MSIYYVFQGVTYSQERSGGYVWSPKRDKNGNNNAGYKMMTNIRKGDFILHNSNGKIESISVAVSDCFDAPQPHEIKNKNKPIEWNNNGYRVNLNYFDLKDPVFVPQYKSWFTEHYNEKSAFTKKGTGKQQYMCQLAEEHAIFLLRMAINNPKNKEALPYLESALSEIIGDIDSEYAPIDKELINELISNYYDGEEIPSWNSSKKTQELTLSSATGREIPKRSPLQAANALRKALFKCEYNEKDLTFLRKNGKPYTEPHHLIPLSKYKDFKYSLDVMENIVSLCSHCHNLLHYGRFEDKLPILRKLYEERKDVLKKCGLELTFEQLASYYK